MQRMMIWGGLTCLSACLVKPTLVSIAPDYGYVDGCVDVTIQGNHLGTKASGDVGGAALTNIVPAKNDPKRPDYAQDVGFLYTAQVPPSPDGKAGFQDVHFKVDGANLTIPLGFYYRDCPASFIVDAVSLPGDALATPSTAVAVGDTVGLIGCGLDPATVTVEYHLATVAVTGGTGDTGGGTPVTTVDPTAAATSVLVDDCSTARAHTVVPAGLAPGSYEVWLRHTDGTLYASTGCTARGGSKLPAPITTSYGYTTTWTGDSLAACGPISVTVGGAR